MMSDPSDRSPGAWLSGVPDAGDVVFDDRVQCPNCCRLARITRRAVGLVFYRCELCETVGAALEGVDPPPGSRVDP